MAECVQPETAMKSPSFLDYFTFSLAHKASLLIRQQYTFLCTAHNHFFKWGFSIFEKGIM